MRDYFYPRIQGRLRDASALKDLAALRRHAAMMAEVAGGGLCESYDVTAVDERYRLSDGGCGFGFFPLKERTVVVAVVVNGA